MSNASTIPVLIGELGQINPGASGLDITFPRDVLRQLATTAISSGHNGAFGWMWKWCDQNTMVGTADGTESSDFLNLNTYGNMYVTEYYSKNL